WHREDVAYAVDEILDHDVGPSDFVATPDYASDPGAFASSVGETTVTAPPAASIFSRAAWLNRWAVILSAFVSLPLPSTTTPWYRVSLPFLIIPRSTISSGVTLSDGSKRSSKLARFTSIHSFLNMLVKPRFGNRL